MILEIKNLKLAFSSPMGPKEVLRGVDLKIAPGEIFGLVGESGSGKSQTGLAIMGLNSEHASLNADTFKFDKLDLLGATPTEFQALRGLRIGMIFQNPKTSLAPHMRIGAAFREVLCVRRGESLAAANKIARELLTEVGLSNLDRLLKSFPHELSGGMNQRVMIALTVALEPQLLIADEPTTALDVTTQKLVLELLSRLTRKRGQSVLMISHDLGVVRQTCDSLAVMYAGRIVEQGRMEDVLGAPAHPYTQALKSSRPSLSEPLHRLVSIDGRPPHPGELIHGCAFAPRCSHATALCEEDTPQVHTVKTHQVACVLNGGKGLQ